MARAPGQFRGKRPRAGASFGGAQWGPEPPDINAPKEPRLTYGKTAAQLDAEIAEALAQRRGSGSSHSSKPAQPEQISRLAPVHHDRLAHGIATVVRDQHFWRTGRFNLAEALQVLAPKRGHYDWQRVKDYTDDYLQKVAGTASASGEGIPSRATHPITKYEVDAVNAIVAALKRAEKKS